MFCFERCGLRVCSVLQTAANTATTFSAAGLRSMLCCQGCFCCFLCVRVKLPRGMWWQSVAASWLLCCVHIHRCLHGSPCNPEASCNSMQVPRNITHVALCTPLKIKHLCCERRCVGAMCCWWWCVRRDMRTAARRLCYAIAMPSNVPAFFAVP